MDRLENLVTDSSDRDLPPAAQPEMAVLEEERGPVLLRRDREFGTGPHHVEAGERQLDPALLSRVCLHHTVDDYGCFLRELPDHVPNGLGQVPSRGNALEIAGPVTEDDERDFPAGSYGDDPAGNFHRAANRRSEVADIRMLH